ncbi:unnamed protein product [Withania somnifera]
MTQMEKDIENLMSARKFLRANFEESNTLGIIQRLPSLEAAKRPIRAQKDALGAVGGHINRAIVPAMAVLKVFDAIHGLEKSLSDPQLDLPGYLGWLADIVEYLEDHAVADARFTSSMKQALTSLRELHSGEEKGRLDGGLLELGRLIANNRLEKCVSIYVDVRSSNISVSEFNDVQSIEGHIAQWGKHLEFSVKHLLVAEYKLCNDVFEQMGLDVWMSCFGKIAAQAGILAFLQFGKIVTESKKNPIKLLKLLDIFASLNKLRLDFSLLFGRAACVEIQNLTRNLIKSVIEGASEIFWELIVQVELQRHMPPPPDGSIPKLIVVITDYCNKLLGNDYKSILTQVLIIERSWKQEKFQEHLLINELLNIMRAVDVNLETWSKAYQDFILAYVFFMNNHWHLYKHLKGTKLGGLLGGSQLREHEHREGLILFSGGRATARGLVKKRLKAFNEAFYEMYEKQSNCVMLDKELCDKTCQLIIQAIVPWQICEIYGSIFGKMLNSLFHRKPVTHGSVKVRHHSGKFRNVITYQDQTSPTVK